MVFSEDLWNSPTGLPAGPLLGNALFPGGEVTYQKVALRLVQPEWKFFNLTFLVLGLSHGLNGMWAISEDYITREWLRMTLFGVVLMAGLCLLVFGTLNILAFQPTM